MSALTGKAVVITGSGSGLGAAYAKYVAGLGAAVVVNDIDTDKARATATQITENGGKAVAEAGDVSDWAFADRLVETCMDAFGTLTGFVNNAGIFRPALMDEATEDDFRRMVEVNYIGTVACAQAAARQLKKLGNGGSIVNVSSGSQAGDIALSGYGATKAAVASFTFSAAMELRGSGIRVNAVSPLAETAMSAQNAHLMELQAKHRDVHYAKLPAAEVNAPVIAFLLSDAAKDIHGQIVRIAGRQLSYVTHPLIAAPVLEDDWDFEKVASAFANTLSSRQQKLGLAFADDAG